MDALIADAVAEGATLIAGGKRNGTIMEATLLDNVKPDMRIYAEEILPTCASTRKNPSDP